MRKGWVFLLSAALFLLTILTSCKSSHQEKKDAGQEKWVSVNLLILHSYHQGLPWTDEIQRTLLNQLFENKIHGNIFTEYLDSLRDPNYEKNIGSYLFSKYKKISLSAIVISDNTAFEWIKKNRSSFAPNVPIIFCGLNYFHPDLLKGLTQVTGVGESPSLEENLDLMRLLHPQSDHLLVLGDSNITFEKNKAALEEAVSKMRKPFRLTYFTNPILSSILEEIKKLTPETLIFLMTRPRDDQNRFLPEYQSVPAISSLSPVPVYSAWDFFLGYGIVGGKLISGHSQGVRTASLLIQILNGTPPENLPVFSEEANEWVFDARQLARFQIDFHQLPKGSRILFHTPSFYEKYQGLVRGTLFVFFMLIITLSILLMNTYKRKKAELEARLSERRWKFALEGSGQGIWDWDLDKNTVFYSPAYKTMLGYEENDFTNQPQEWEKRIHPQDRDWVFNELNRHLKGFTPDYRALHRVLRKDGTFHWILARGKIMERDLTGKPIRMIGTHTDMSEQKNVEEMLQHSKEEAEKSNRAKSDFLSNMSHELRTPLTGIIGCAYLLADRPMADENKDLVTIIKSSADLLLNLINDLLDLSKIEAGKMRIQSKAFCFDSVFNEIRQAYQDRVILKGLSWTADKQAEVPAWMTADELRLKQILNNLLSNALKFTEQGEIRFSADYDQNFLILKVSDTGIGIHPEKMSRLFEKFDQGEYYMTKRFGGTGLGLAIVKNLVDLMSGRIEVQSTPDKGTVFTVLIPAPEADPQENKSS